MMNKIEKLIEKIEESANKKLMFLAGALKYVWIKLLPKKLLAGYFQVKKRLYEKALRAKNVSKDRALSSKSFIERYAQKANDVSNKIQGYSVKSEASKAIGEFQNALLNTPLKNHASFIGKRLTSILDKMAFFFGKFKSPQTLIATGAMLMILFGTYGIYVSSQNIYMQEWGSRSPASQDQYLNRPAYLKFPQRTLKVFNVKVPIYVESVRAIKSVTVDFTIRTDTRFAKQFLEEYEYKLKDYFFMTTEPVISTFPLKDEGKSILKDKIQDELNSFLAEERVEGKVEEVDIIFIVGS